MHENISGAVSETAGISIEEVARQDRLRALAEEYRQRRTRQRHGNKGSRVWGYTTPGSGKRRRK